MALYYSEKNHKKRENKDQIVTVLIEKLDSFGQGIAFLNDKPIFIPNALPSERVKVKITEHKKNLYHGIVQAYLSQHPERIEPRCPHYQLCGGCQMQHIPIQWQHQIKKEHLIHLFKKETALDLSVNQISILNSESYQYRRRARIALYYKNHQLLFGFRKAFSDQILTIDECPVLLPELQKLIPPLKQHLMELNERDQKALGHLDLLSVNSGTVIILRITTSLTLESKLTLINFAKKHQITVYLHQESLALLYGKPDLYYHIDDLTLHFSPLDFLQVNPSINHKMIDVALQWLEIKPSDKLLDLYCGMGNISLPLATRANKVIGIEVVDELIKTALKNNLQNQDLMREPVEFIKRDLNQNDLNFNIEALKINKVILDPSRDGAKYVIPSILYAKPEQILYISCNPATLARDCKMIIESKKYQLSKIAILDMFPQTKHIESMLLFTKRPN